MAKIWDISQVLSARTPVWPGDVRVHRQPTWTMADGSPVNVASMHLSTHSGTHADAPLHYVEGGTAIAQVELEPYLGPCLVIDGRGKGDLVRWQEIKDPVTQGIGKGHELGPLRRVLIRTFDTFPSDQWPESFRAIDPSVIDGLAELGVCLIGTDAPSLDPETSKDLAAHRAVARHRLAILEGLVLDQVPFGAYELIALPLALDALDASPVRAILRK